MNSIVKLHPRHQEILIDPAHDGSAIGGAETEVPLIRSTDQRAGHAAVAEHRADTSEKRPVYTPAKLVAKEPHLWCLASRFADVIEIRATVPGDRPARLWQEVDVARADRVQPKLVGDLVVNAACRAEARWIQQCDLKIAALRTSRDYRTAPGLLDGSRCVARVVGIDIDEFWPADEPYGVARCGE